MKTYYHKGTLYDLPDEKVDGFLKTHSGAEPTTQFVKNGTIYDIPESVKPAFLKQHKDATEVGAPTAPVQSTRGTTKPYNPDNDPIRKNLQMKPMTPGEALSARATNYLKHPGGTKPIPGGALEEMDKVKAESVQRKARMNNVLDTSALGAAGIKNARFDEVKAADKVVEKIKQEEDHTAKLKRMDAIQAEYNYNEQQLLDYAERRSSLNTEEENDFAYLLKRQANIEQDADAIAMGMTRRQYLNYQVGAEMRKDEPVLSYLDALGTGSLSLFTSPYTLVNPGSGMADFNKYGTEGSMSVGSTFGNIVQSTLASTPLNVMMMVAPELGVPLSMTQVTASNIKDFYDAGTLDTSAVISSIVSGAVQTAIEFASDTGQIKGYQTAYRTGGAKGLEEMIQRDLKAMFSPSLNQMKTKLFKGTMTEGLEEVSQNIADKLINHVINNDAMPTDLKAYAQELAMDFVGGAFGGFVLGAGATGINLVTSRNMMEQVDLMANGKNPYQSVKHLQNAIMAIKSGDMTKAKTELAKAQDLNQNDQISNRKIQNAFALTQDALNAWDVQRTTKLIGDNEKLAADIHKMTSELNALKRDDVVPGILTPEGKKYISLEAQIEEATKQLKNNYKQIAADKDMAAIDEAVGKAVQAEAKLKKLEKKNPNPSAKTQRKIDAATKKADELEHEAAVALNKGFGSVAGEYETPEKPVPAKTKEKPADNNVTPQDKPLTEEEKAQQIKDGTYVPTEEERKAAGEKIELEQSKGMMAGDVNETVDRTDPKESDKTGIAEYGNEIEVKIPKGNKVKVRYTLVPRKSLIVSHDNDFKENPAYPAEIQNRDRGKASNRDQVLNIEANLDPKEVMDTYIAKDGAPIVIRDKNGNFIVLGGNGRMMGINRRADLRGEEAMQEYEAEVASRLEEFGFSPDTDTKGKVLVRTYYGEEDMVETATRLNTDTGQRISPAERASSDATEIANARRKGNDILKLLNITSGDVMSRSNEAFVQAFYDLCVRKEAGEYLTSDGRWTTMLRTRIEMALFSYMNNASSESERLLESFYEADDSRVKNIINGIIDNIQIIVKLRSLIEEHGLLDLDISRTLSEAAAQIDKLRKEGQNIEVLLEDADMFSEGQSLIPEEEKPLYRALYYLSSRKQAVDFVASYYRQAIEAISPEEMTILSGTAETREEFLARAVEEWTNETAEQKAEKERERKRKADQKADQGNNQGTNSDTATPETGTPGTGARQKAATETQDSTSDTTAESDENLIPDKAAEDALIGLFKDQVKTSRKGDPEKGEDPRTLYIEFKDGRELTLNRLTGLITARDAAGNVIGPAIGETRSDSERTVTGNIRIIVDLVDGFNGGNRVLFHEAFHVAWKLFLTADQSRHIIRHYARKRKLDVTKLTAKDMVDIEEDAADDAALWLGNRADTVPGALNNIWRRFWDRVRHALVSFGYYPGSMKVRDIFQQLE
ncbi:MAG TPA: hypothetical protein PKI15_04600, partial [Candidatus Cloacimonadota bacterium]|nr:hypothetical protein [Candidatus Cloacimonadota bacterium]